MFLSPLFLEPLGGVKNLKVTDPTVNSLRVRWDAADGDVRQYNVLYVPVAGGTESVVSRTLEPSLGKMQNF